MPNGRSAAPKALGRAPRLYGTNGGVPKISLERWNQLLPGNFNSKVNVSLLKSVVGDPKFWCLGLAVGFPIAAASLSTDGNFDFKSYHFYNGFAAFHDRRALDIFPAHEGTTYFYGLDALYYYIFTSLNDHPTVINVLLSVPYSIAALALFLSPVCSRGPNSIAQIC